MQLSNAGRGRSNLAGITIEHKGEMLDFGTSEYDRVQFKNSDGMENLFLHINSYVATLDRTRQDAIFDIYAKIYLALGEHVIKATLEPALTGLVAELYTQINYEEVHYFVKRSISAGTIVIHDSLVDVVDQTKYRAQQTYTVDEYIELIALIIMIRLMVPIWSGYMLMIRNEVENSMKEFVAIRLLGASGIYDLRPYKKLQEYVEVVSDAGEAGLGMVMHAMGTAIMPEWTLAKTIVRRLAVVEIPVRDSDVQIVTAIYRCVRSTASGDQESRLPIQVKTRKAMVNSDGDELGVVDRIRAKERLGGSLMRIYDEYLKDIIRFAKAVDPTIPEDLVHACNIYHAPDRQFSITRFQRVLQMWCCHSGKTETGEYRRVMAPRAIYRMTDYTSAMTLAAVTQALLIHWGFSDLAMIATCRVTLKEQTIGVEARTNLQRKNTQALMQLYPPNVEGDVKEPSQKTNVGIKDIVELANEIDQYNIIPNLPTQFASLDTAGRIVDTKNQLAELIVRIKGGTYE